jgi:NAD(P)-dependent dehydrogenase (short-subunit alcohol dehydrogenase family)
MNSPVIILTGASRGLGLAIARTLLSRDGARVATLQRTITPELDELKKAYPERFIAVRGDVAKPEDNQAVVAEAVGAWGRLDGLVLNAGTLEPMGEFEVLAPSEGGG